MNLEKKLAVFFKVSYILLVVLVLYSIYTENMMYELLYKFFALLFLTFLYLTSSKKINNWYLLILIVSIISDSVFVFGADYRLEGTIALFLNRIFYIMIVKDVLEHYSFKRLFNYSFPFWVTFALIFSLIYDSLGALLYPSLIFGVLSVLMLLFTYLKYLQNNKRQSLHFFLGVFLIAISDVIMVITNFLGENVIYIVIYHTTYYIARYIIYSSMIETTKIPSQQSTINS